MGDDDVEDALEEGCLERLLGCPVGEDEGERRDADDEVVEPEEG